MSKIVTETTLELIHKMLTPTVSHPSEIVHVAQIIKDTDPSFDDEKFTRRAVAAWEDHHFMTDGKGEAE